VIFFLNKTSADVAAWDLLALALDDFCNFFGGGAQSGVGEDNGLDVSGVGKSLARAGVKAALAARLSARARS
jgi:hypothetical protein